MVTATATRKRRSHLKAKPNSTAIKKPATVVDEALLRRTVLFLNGDVVRLEIHSVEETEAEARAVVRALRHVIESGTVNWGQDGAWTIWDLAHDLFKQRDEQAAGI